MADEKKNSDDDIEQQGRSPLSGTAASISGRTSTADPSTTLGRIEHVDVEEAAPVPARQQQMVNVHTEGITNSNTIANVNTNLAAPSEDVSTTPQQGAMEQVEEGDDAAPRPLSYAEFDDKEEEDDRKQKLDLGEESTDDDDGPPLPFTFDGQQRDSLRDAKQMAATSIISSADASPMDDRDLNNFGDEEWQRQVSRPETFRGRGNEETRQVISSAPAERYPSVPIPEAYLVEEEDPPTAVVATPPPPIPLVTPGGHDTVYEATPLEPELSSWKQRRTKVFMVIILALAVGLGVALSRQNSNRSTGTTMSSSSVSLSPSQSPTSLSPSLSPSQSPTKTSYRCFADRNELKAGVDQYVENRCGAVATLCKDLSDTYGWPMGSWCVVDVKDMSSLFQGLDTFNEDISMWNVSHVADMSYMFQNATSFNQNLCEWQNNFPYSSATDIFLDSGCVYKGTPSSDTKGPFCASYCNTVSSIVCFVTRDELKAAIFQYVQGYWGTADSSKYGWPIGSWCVDRVTDMSELFLGLDTFNEDISGWEVGQVTTMRTMFSGASAFNGDISSWDTSSVTDMTYMFYGASSFNQDLSKWNASAVTTMYAMFSGASAFNGDISSWDTSTVTDMSSMFLGASSFNQDLSKWNTSAVTTMYYMFGDASAFDGNISSWDTSAVTDMSYMFERIFSGASSFNQDLSKWNTSAVTKMNDMFYEASFFNGDISSWDTSAVTDMSLMFSGALAFNGNISSWDTSAVTDMSGMFWGATSFNQNLCAWKDQFPYYNATDMFLDSGCTFQGNPQIETQGPFCASDCTNR